MICLWELRWQYPHSDELAESDPDWDQCTTCWAYADGALSAIAQTAKQWLGDNAIGVMPERLVSCEPIKVIFP